MIYAVVQLDMHLLATDVCSSEAKVSCFHVGYNALPAAALPAVLRMTYCSHCHVAGRLDPLIVLGSSRGPSVILSDDKV